MIFKSGRIIDLISPLIYLLIFFALLDNYLLQVFKFKTKGDEAILFILNVFFFVHLTNEIFIKNKLSKFEIPLVIFFSILTISALLNYETGLSQKIIGSYYLVKSINLLYLIYRFGVSQQWLKKILNLVIYTALISVGVQVIQFIVPSISTMTAGLVPPPYLTDNFIRCTGLLGASNRTAQLLVIAYIANRLLGNGPLHYRTFIFMLGLLLASSNLNIFLFGLVLMLDVVRDNKKLIVPLSLFIFLGLIYAGNSFFYRLEQLYELAYVDESYFRLSAFLNSLDVLGDNLWAGVGPGMYGGSVAAIMGSPLHEQYAVFSYYGNAQHMPTTIDMFWPHFWAEVGLLGMLVFLSIFYKIIIKNHSVKAYEFYFLNILVIFFLISGVSMLNVESTFSSVIVYTIIGTYMYWEKRNAYRSVVEFSGICNHRRKIIC